MTLGQDDTVLATVGAHVDGLVVAGFGVGHVPAEVVPVLTNLAARIPVILASRTGAGPVAASTYGFAGSESDLLGRGLIRAGYLDPYKARILLHLLLVARADPTEIRRAFADLGGYQRPNTTPTACPGAARPNTTPTARSDAATPRPPGAGPVPGVTAPEGDH
jgi:L-asparaginase